MANKSFEKLWEIEQRIRRMFPTEMWAGNETIVNIRYFGGFELFNTRPYHNYETWSEGWEITSGPRFGEVKVTAEDLDDALKLFEERMKLWEQGFVRTDKERPEEGQEIVAMVWQPKTDKWEAVSMVYGQDGPFFFFWRPA